MLRHFDQSTWLANRAQQIPVEPPPRPKLVALPAAREAIPVDTLEAHQQLGRRESEIVARINTRWAERHADEIAAQAEWANRTYRDLVVELQERDQQARATELRRQATLERLAREQS